MDEQELDEAIEKARRPEQKRVGLTMAIVAVLLAIATLGGHRLHTEEVVLQTRAADQWAYYQAKNSRTHMYAADAKIATAIGAQASSLASDFQERSENEKSGAEEVRKKAESMEDETQQTAKRAGYFDGAEIFLEIAIVLCSITLLTEMMLFWKVSFVSSAVGVAIAIIGLLVH